MKRIISVACLSALAFSVMAESTYTFKALNSTKSVLSHKDTTALKMTRGQSVQVDALDNSLWALFKTRAGMKGTTWDALVNLGIEITAYDRFGDMFVYQLRLNNNSAEVMNLLKSDANFINTISMEPSDKIDTELWNKRELNYENKGNNTLKITAEFIKGTTKDQKIKLLTAVGAQCDFVDEDSTEIRYIIATYEQVIEIAKSVEVVHLKNYVVPQTLNHESRELTGINELQKDFYLSPYHYPSPGWLSSYKYTGKGVSIAINEHPRKLFHKSDSMGYRHLDLSYYSADDTIMRTDEAYVKRGNATAVKYPPYSDWYLTEHGTHVAGIAAGNGWKSRQDPYGAFRYRGVAPKATVYTHGDKGHTNNHSFTGRSTAQWYAYHNDTTSPEYGRVGVFSAGNFQSDPVYVNRSGYYSLSQDHKNGIIVGASFKDRKILAPWSSCGPTRDGGMIKPDVVAPGAGNYTTVPDHIFPDSMFVGGEIEIDSIAILNNGAKLSWGFSYDYELWDKGNPTGGTAHLTKITRDGSIMKVDADQNGYFFTPRFRSYNSTNTDTLLIRWRSSGNHEVPIIFHWATSGDNFLYGEDEGYPYKVLFTEQLSSGWKTTKIPLNQGGWVAGMPVTNFCIFNRVEFNDNGVTSCSKDQDYHGSSGTSMSGPFVTGVTALMLQKYKETILADYNSQNGTTHNLRSYPMWNSSVRGALIHTAEDMIDTVGISPGFNSSTRKPVTYGKGPDWATGWGFIDGKRAVDYVDDEHMLQATLDEGDSVVYTVYAYDGPMRVTLTWDDPSTSQRLTNDLDMYVQHVATGEMHRPWILDATPMLPAKSTGGIVSTATVKANGATKGIDTVNTVEVVDIEYPRKGMYRIVIKGSAISTDQNPTVSGKNQDYSLITDTKATKMATPTQLYYEDFNSYSSSSVSNTGWETYVDYAASASAYIVDNYTPGNKSLHTFISNLGTTGWHIHARIGGMNLKNGESYTLKFKAKTESGKTRNIDAKLQEDGNDWTVYGAQIMTIDGTLKEYSYTFTMTDGNDSNAYISIDMGKVVSWDGAWDVVLDDVELLEN